MSTKTMSRSRLLLVLVALAALMAFRPSGSTAAPTGLEIRLTYATFDPLLGEPQVPAALQASAGSRHALLQLIGPPRPEQLSGLRAAGVVFYDYVPTYTYIVRLPQEGAAAVSALPGVRWIGDLHPAYKISPFAKGGELLLDLFPDADLAAVEAAVRATGAAVLERSDGERSKILIVRADASLLPVLAAIDQVRWVQPRPVNRLMNDQARWVVQSGEANRTPLLDRGLTGAGQVGAASDSGLDVYDFAGAGDPNDAGCYFRDDGADGATANQLAPGPAHRKVVGYTVPEGAGGDFTDDNGHGTHVVGSIVGDQAPWGALSPSDGQAHEARIFFQDLNDDGSNSVYAPADYRLMFGQTYDFNGDGVYQPDLEPRTHSNSWGGVDSTYDAGSAQADDFMWTHPDFLILFAAGNQGPAPATIGSPATAKSIVTVGATENGQGNPDNVASFSSHGPVPVSQLLKPTIVAPGDGVVSALFKNPCGTQSLSGTSMATPTIQGVALLMRQYLWDGYWPKGERDAASRVHPSAALLKALLMNSGRPISGLFTDNAIGGGWPSNGQGWGRVQAEDALYFQGDHRALAFHDEYALDGSRGFNAPGQTRTFTFEVRDGQPFSREPLEITLVWSDYQGSTLANGALVNDLDLVVTDPLGGIHRGNDRATNDFTDATDLPLFAPDTINPFEVVALNQPMSGTYTVTITASSLGSLALDPARKQSFALVATGDLVGRRGRAEIDLPAYNANPMVAVRLRVTDLDLDASPVLTDSVTVTISSETTPGGVTVSLTETGPHSGLFAGSVTVTTAAATAGQLRVSPGDTLLLTYQDADDGTGSPYTAYDTAAIQEPLLSAVNPPVLNDPGEVDGDGDYTLTWSHAEDTTGLTGYEIQRSTNYVEPLFDNAEGSLAASWTTSNAPPFNPPWTQSPVYSSSPVLSFLSGGQEGGANLLDQESTLTLSRDLTIPTSVESARLTFWSRYFNEPDDFGNVEISTDGGSTWTPLLVLSAAPLPPPAGTRMQHHEIDLTAYRGTPFRLRFRFSTGPSNFFAYVTAGWWIDDVTVSGATWSTLAIVGPDQTSYEIEDQRNGRYFHWVRGVYAADATATAWSNVEDVVVDRPRTILLVDDADPAMEYRDGWHRQENANASNGGFHRRSGVVHSPDLPAPHARLAFTGNEITYFYGTQVSGGTANLYIDGQLRETISYKGNTQAPVFGASRTYSGLVEGPHEIRVEFQGGTVIVDGFRIVSEGGQATADASAVQYRSVTQAGPADLNGLAGQVVLRTVKVGPRDEQVSVVVEGSAQPLLVNLLSPLGVVVASGRELLAGSPLSGLDAAVSTPGTYTVQVINQPGLSGRIDISVARTVKAK